MVKSVGGPGNWAGGGCSKHFCLLGVATLLLDVISGRILNLSFHSSFCLHMLALSLPCRFLLEFALLGRGACLKSMSSIFSPFSCYRGLQVLGWDCGRQTFLSFGLSRVEAYLDTASGYIRLIFE